MKTSRQTVNKKQRICLYGLESPVLIVPSKTGIFYYNQTNGCGCNQREIEGYLIPLPFADPMKYVFCNHLLWYEKGWNKLPPPKSWKKLGISFEETAKDLRNNEKSRICLWWDEVCESIFEFGENGGGYDMQVMKTVPQEEAWFRVRIVLNGKRVEAILTWGNCD